MAIAPADHVPRGKLQDIPGVNVQGRYDCCTPPSAAFDLKRAWPEAELVIVPTAATSSPSPAYSTA